MAVVQLGSPAGAFFGSTIAGLVAAAYDWRTAFLAFAVPGFVVAALLLWLTPEPERGQQDAGAASQSVGPTSSKQVSQPASWLASHPGSLPPDTSSQSVCLSATQPAS